MYFDGISPNITLEGYHFGIVTDLLPVEPSVASGVFINFHRAGGTFGDHRWDQNFSTGGPPVATAKAADATSVVHRWGFGGTSVTTGGLRLVSNPGKQRVNPSSKILKQQDSISSDFIREGPHLVRTFLRSSL